jgi:molybdopterin-synthase adenylyltransferase
VTAPNPKLSRYSRQTVLPVIGQEGQRRLLGAHAAIIGIGALGCASADMLARAGIGTLTLIDRDVVEVTNLQRQTLFTEADAREALPKAEAAAARLRGVNSAIEIRAVVADVVPRNIGRLLRGVGVVVDGTDNFGTRFLLNDSCVKQGVPWVYAGVIGTGGATMTIIPGETACLRCVFEDAPPPGTGGTCDTVGVLGPAVMLIGAAQSAEVMKLLVGKADHINRGLRTFDLWSNAARSLENIHPRPDCPCCGLRRFEFLDNVSDETAALCGRDAVQVWPRVESHLDLPSLAARLAGTGEIRSGPSFVRFTPAAEGLELTVFADGRAIVKGTTQPSRARVAYAKYVGS